MAFLVLVALEPKTKVKQIRYLTLYLVDKTPKYPTLNAFRHDPITVPVNGNLLV